MERNAEKNRFLQFYIGSLVLFLTLAAVGCYWADRAGLISVRPATPAASAPREVITDMAYVDLPRMTVSLGSGVARQARIDISLEVARKDIPVLEGYMPQIMDRLNGFFPKVEFEDIDEPNSMFLLHKDMLRQVNNVGMPISVHDLMLRSLLVM